MAAVSKMGRPSIYDKAWIKITKEYFDNPELHGDTISTKTGLACLLGISRETLYKYIKSKKDFGNIVKAGEMQQERQIINLLLDKERYTSGAIFVAKNILGWRDKAELAVDNTPMKQTQPLYEIVGAKPVDDDSEEWL